MERQLLKTNADEAGTNGQTNITSDAPKEPSGSKHSALQITTLKKKIPKKRRKPLTKTQKLCRFVDKFFMLLCLAVIIPLASQWPIGHNEGPLHPKITSSWIVTIILFFGIGLGVKLEYLKRACMFWQMNVFCHFVIFVYYPIVGWGINQIAGTLPEGVVSKEMKILLEGVIILCTLPATAASAVVFTTNANGNEAAAAINCTLSNLLGIFLTPGLILIFMGSGTTINAGEVFYKLSLRVIAPFFVAQIIRVVVGTRGRAKLKDWKPIIKKINEASLLYMVFCALSESFYVGFNASLTDLVIFLGLIELLHLHAYLAIWLMGSAFRCCMAQQNKGKSKFMAFTIYDRVACVYSGVSKTIALGIPLIETIYGEDENVGMYILPILFYHPSNLIWGSIMVEPLKKLVATERKTLSSYSGTMSAFTEVTHNTDYGTLTPYKFDAHNSFMFEPFTPLPDNPEGNESDDEEHSTSINRDKGLYR